MTAPTDSVAPSLRGAWRALVILLVAAVAAFVYEHVTFTGDALRTEGRVVEAIRQPSGPTGDPEALVVRFEHEGRPYHFTTSRSVFQQWSDDHRVGGILPIAYDPSDPAHARLDDFFHLHPASATMLTVAAILLVVTLVLSSGMKKARGSA